MNPNNNTNKNQGHSRHGHHTIVDITHIIAGIRNNLETKQRATAQQFTYSTYNDQNHCIAKTITHTIKE